MVAASTTIISRCLFFLRATVTIANQVYIVISPTSSLSPSLSRPVAFDYENWIYQSVLTDTSPRIFVVDVARDTLPNPDIRTNDCCGSPILYTTRAERRGSRTNDVISTSDVIGTWRHLSAVVVVIVVIVSIVTADDVITGLSIRARV